MIYAFIYQNYSIFTMRLIKVGVKVAQIGLILPLYQRFESQSSHNSR